MAIKDWKKTREDVWKETKDNNGYIYITWHGSQGKVRYDVFRTLNINYGGTALKKNFKTKTNALKFAKAYMRTH